MKVSENTSVSMPIKNMVGIIVAVAMGIFAYTEVTARLTSLETSRELFQADLLKKSEQLPTDQEQFMLLEHISTQVENVQKEMETMRNNNVNINYAMKDIEKIKQALENLKDKVRANGNGTH
ncbi:Fibrinogen-like coiled coil protein [uncultured Mediterranean phage uvMED]|jgi:L-cysteine desulfidase|nr:Fibrinogen-like coiled coil protein [uncultured Mediterranean phage uvMED]BAR37783.1 Fibrinogen-like coiled coil protein [uncultured Mediterranean phage uvMED]BAR37944.1 Fibrinogen-like coiled coil protein [uncultured Mediterranean phage uvMED]|tara:strand:- start:32 stop:397 length:366 start_codon:yes stop_codon:yes gene_type:complete